MTHDPLSAVVRAHSAGWLPDDQVAVGFSGGPDSCALLHAMVAAGVGGLLGVHVDHGMRPESAGDAAAAAALAAAWGVPCQVVRLATAPRNETEAREGRHAALAAAGRRIVALGHTADDQVETLLLRIARGTGIAGLRGMSAFEPGPAGAAIVRPLLELPRDAIMAYLDRHGIVPLEDPTNADPTFADRNLVRHGAVPALRQVNPRLAEAVGRLAELAREDDDALGAWAARELAGLLGAGAGTAEAGTEAGPTRGGGGAGEPGSEAGPARGSGGAGEPGSEAGP
ncbi:MAG: tRNA lysidine(34) synthetase TilS, partial [Candidatus Sericytochromatia bacterium]|nr:tRNA lysidine(34) synthetase TilS [Candidatus Tanganyikabacteria bacterium]